MLGHLSHWPFPWPFSKPSQEHRILFPLLILNCNAQMLLLLYSLIITWSASQWICKTNFQTLLIKRAYKTSDNKPTEMCRVFLWLLCLMSCFNLFAWDSNHFLIIKIGSEHEFKRVQISRLCWVGYKEESK